MNLTKRQRVHEHIEEDADASGGSQDADSSRKLVFRLLHGAPSTMKYAPAPLASKPLFSSTASVISVHETQSERGGQLMASFSATGAPQLLENLDMCPLQMLREDLLTWDVSHPAMPFQPLPYSDSVRYLAA